MSLEEGGALESELDQNDRRDIARSAAGSLALQSRPGVYGHWVLASVVLLTDPTSRSHPFIGALAATWLLLLGLFRLAVATSFVEMWPSRPRLWKVLFRTGLALSSATWGLGGSILLAESAFDQESRLVLLSIAGIAAAGIASTAADVLVLRLHLVLLLLPTWLAGLLFMPGTMRLTVGYAVVVGCYSAFLWVQGGHAHALFIGALIKTKLLERQAGQLDVARRDSLRRNRDMRMVLDTMAQGLVTIDKDGALGEERSRAIDTWFAKPAPGMKFWKLFGQGHRDVTASLQLGLEQVFEDALPLEVALEQLPRRIESGERVYDLKYESVDGAAVTPTRLLVMISDVTDRLHAEQSEADQREQMNLFSAATRDRSALAEFIRETSEMVSFVGEQFSCADSRLEVLRALHTVKGNAGLMGLTRFSTLCHEIEIRIAEAGTETSMARADKEALQAAWSLLSRRADGFLAGLSTGVEVTATEIAELTSAIERGETRRELMGVLERWSMEPVTKRLTLLGEQARRLAERLGKPAVIVETTAEGIRLPIERFLPFWNTLPHVLRNAIDHGLEPSPQRLAAGKSEFGHLRMSACEVGGQVVIEVTDDGRGIDWASLREKARAAGLPFATADDLVEALFVDGISTRDEATEISGRGVGLSAVRAVCGRLGGRIQVESVAGVGTTMRFSFSPSGHPMQAREGVPRAPDAGVGVHVSGA